MDLSNAKIIRIDRLSGVDGNGTPTFATGAPIAVKCIVDDPRFHHMQKLGAAIKDVAGILYVMSDQLGTNTFASGDRVLIQMNDEEAQTLYELQQLSHRVKDALTHYEAALKAI